MKPGDRVPVFVNVLECDNDRTEVMLTIPDHRTPPGFHSMAVVVRTKDIIPAPLCNVCKGNGKDLDWYCPQCFEYVSNDVTHCHECGAMLDQKHNCLNCGGTGYVGTWEDYEVK